MYRTRSFKYPEIFSPLLCKKIQIGAIEIWLLKNFWPFINMVGALILLTVHIEIFSSSVSVFSPDSEYGFETS